MLHSLSRTEDTARIKNTFEHDLLKLLYTRIRDYTCLNNYVAISYCQFHPKYLLLSLESLNLAGEASKINVVRFNADFVKPASHGLWSI